MSLNTFIYSSNISSPCLSPVEQTKPLFSPSFWFRLKESDKRHASSQTQSLPIWRPPCPSPEECPAGPDTVPPPECIWHTSWSSPLSSHTCTLACPFCTFRLSGRTCPAYRCNGRPNSIGLGHIRRGSSSIWGRLRSTTQGRFCCSISKWICKPWHGRDGRDEHTLRVFLSHGI